MEGTCVIFAAKANSPITASLLFDGVVKSLIYGVAVVCQILDILTCIVSALTNHNALYTSPFT